MDNKDKMSHLCPSTPTLAKCENPAAFLKVEAQPPPMYDDIVKREEERFVPDIENSGEMKKETIANNDFNRF